jgi:hypothetical protein
MKAFVINPDHLSAWIVITAAYELRGKQREDQKAAKQILRIQPEFSLKIFEEPIVPNDENEKYRYIGGKGKAKEKALLSEPRGPTVPTSGGL